MVKFSFRHLWEPLGLPFQATAAVTVSSKEYWHSHIDTEQYGTFAFTTLLYLNSQDEDERRCEFPDETWRNMAELRELSKS